MRGLRFALAVPVNLRYREAEPRRRRIEDGRAVLENFASLLRTLRVLTSETKVCVTDGGGEPFRSNLHA